MNPDLVMGKRKVISGFIRRDISDILMKQALMKERATHGYRGDPNVAQSVSKLKHSEVYNAGKVNRYSYPSLAPIQPLGRNRTETQLVGEIRGATRPMEWMQLVKVVWAAIKDEINPETEKLYTYKDALKIASAKRKGEIQ